MLLNPSAPKAPDSVLSSRTSKHTPIPAKNESTPFLPSNQSRAHIEVFNDSDGILYLRWGSLVSISAFTVRIRPGGYWQPPVGCRDSLRGMWVGSTTGNAQITEYLNQ